MKKLDSFADRLFGIMIRFSGIVLILLMTFLFVNVLLRLFFNAPIRGSTEMVRYAALVGGSFALAQNEWFDGNIRVTMLLELLPTKAANVIAFLGYVFVSCGISFIVYFLIQQMLKYFRSGTLTIELSLPTGIFSGILAFGFFVLMICFCIKAIFYGYKIFVKNSDQSLGLHRAALE